MGAASLLLHLLAAVRAATSSMPVAADTACQRLKWGDDTIPDSERSVSPLDSITLYVSGKAVKICYGRPSLRGRTMIGGREIPYGSTWRTGANEPTIFFTPITLFIAGLEVPPGKYSLYTVPGETDWTIVVNRITDRWGSDIDRFRAQDLGRVTVKRLWLQAPVETLTLRAEPAGANTQALVLEWEWTRVRVPVAARASVRPASVHRSDKRPMHVHTIQR